jgi:hypothetical protein
MVRPNLIPTTVLALICAPGCAEIALVTSAQNSFDINTIQERQAINVWSDEKVTAERTKCLLARGSEDIETIAVVAPSWSYGGMAVRLACPVGQGLLYQPELQAAALTDSGVHLRLFIDGNEQSSSGLFKKEWYRVPVSQSMIEAAQAGGMVVRVVCEVGEWTFRLTPTYFLGFNTKLAELQRTQLRVQLSDQHQPASP